METIKVQKNQIIAKQKEKVKDMVFNFRRFGRTEKFLCEDCSEQRKCDRCLGKDRFLCDYIAREDSVLAVFPYNTADDLINALNGQESMRGTLLRAALKQRQMLLEMYAGFKICKTVPYVCGNGI